MNQGLNESFTNASCSTRPPGDECCLRFEMTLYCPWTRGNRRRGVGTKLKNAVSWKLSGPSRGNAVRIHVKHNWLPCVFGLFGWLAAGSWNTLPNVHLLRLATANKRSKKCPVKFHSEVETGSFRLCRWIKPSPAVASRNGPVVVTYTTNVVTRYLFTR